MRFEEFGNVHEDDLLVGVLDADETPDEVFPDHVQHLDIVALSVHLLAKFLKNKHIKAIRNSPQQSIFHPF